jgi:hypothetical protein
MTITNTAAADSETDLAVGDVQRYADAGNPSAYLAFSKGNRYFRTPGAPGVIIYRAAGRYLVQFAGPFAPLDAQAVLQRAFAEHAAEQGLEHVAVQVQHADTPAFLELGYSVNQMGSSYAVSLAEFTLAGTRFMQLRNKISRALRAGIEIHEAEYAPWADRIRSLDEAWLRSKGEGVGALEFLVGQTGGRETLLRRRDEATRAYQGPFKEQVERFGRLVFGASFGVTVDADLRIASRTLDGRTDPYAELSTGAREAVAMCVRLACAALVGPDGGVPVIIDDALGAADPGRRRMLGALLNHAGSAGVSASSGAAAEPAQLLKPTQIIIFTCDPDRYRAVGSAQVRSLGHNNDRDESAAP